MRRGLESVAATLATAMGLDSHAAENFAEDCVEAVWPLFDHVDRMKWEAVKAIVGGSRRLRDAEDRDAEAALIIEEAEAIVETFINSLDDS